MSQPAHVSYSSLTSWLACGEKYRLTRVENLPEAPSWWLAGGKAVHEATEYADRAVSAGGSFDAEEGFLRAFEVHAAPLAGRDDVRSSRGQDGDWWRANGPGQVKSWMDWRTETGWNIWSDRRHGVDGIETDVSTTLAGVEVKAYVDRLFVDGNGELVVVDIKSGARAPSSTLQLGVYAALLEAKYGDRPTLGAYFMSRKGALSAPVPLDRYTQKYVSAFMDGFYRARELGVFLPNPDSFCSTCGVASHCWQVQGGEPYSSALNATTHREGIQA